MKKLCALLFIVLSIFTVSCTTTSLYNVQDETVPARFTTVDQVGKAIAKGVTSQGWQILSQKPGIIVATYTNNRATATVTISYIKTNYSITRKSSTGFFYDPDQGTIKRHYNWWVASLQKSINAALLGHDNPNPPANKAAQ